MTREWLSEHELAECTRGQWLAPPVSPAIGCAIDTRALTPGRCFVAFRGERTDGHRFLAQAARAGAPMAIVEDGSVTPSDAPGLGLLRVESSEDAMWAMAGAWRPRLSARVVAVTGSSGKTTTVRLIDAALRGTLKGTRSDKSHNNRLGVALTLLNTPADAEYLVAEVGMSARGEIADLASVVRPDVGVITNAGSAHLEGLGSLEAIAEEKASLLDHLSSEGVAVLPDPPGRLGPHAERHPGRVVRFGSGACADVRVGEVESGDHGVRFSIGGARGWSVPMAGAHQALNASAAIAVARELGAGDGTIRAGLARAEPPPMRFERVERGGVSLIQDAYNANPESMRAALEAFGSVATGGRRILVLGDMGELGDRARAAHADLLEPVLAVRPDAVLLLGPCTAALAEVLRAQAGELARWSVEVIHEPSLGDEAADRMGDHLARRVGPGDLVLFKASRSVRLERVLDRFAARVGSTSPADSPGGGGG